MTDTIPLADAIAALRQQLSEAVKAGEQETVRFELGPVEMELNLVVEREGKAGGAVQFKLLGWGVDGSGEGKLSQQRTQRVKLTLKPLMAPAPSSMAHTQDTLTKAGPYVGEPLPFGGDEPPFGPAGSSWIGSGTSGDDFRFIVESLGAGLPKRFEIKPNSDVYNVFRNAWKNSDWKR